MTASQQPGTRRSQAADAEQISLLLNEIIRIGGTTAYQNEWSVLAVAKKFIEDQKLICSHVAHDDSGAVLGFQCLWRHDKLPTDWGDIATFARPTQKVRGVGRVLFGATHAVAERLECTTLNATIRADNSGGLAYYEKMGFRTYDIARDVPLHDGTLVDRISKRFDILT